MPTNSALPPASMPTSTSAHRDDATVSYTVPEPDRDTLVFVPQGYAGPEAAAVARASGSAGSSGSAFGLSQPPSSDAVLLPSAAARKGSGLGLALTASLIERMGGFVALAQLEDGRTHCVMVIPCPMRSDTNWIDDIDAVRVAVRDAARPQPHLLASSDSAVTADSPSQEHVSEQTLAAQASVRPAAASSFTLSDDVLELSGIKPGPVLRSRSDLASPAFATVAALLGNSRLWRSIQCAEAESAAGPMHSAPVDTEAMRIRIRSAAGTAFGTQASLAVFPHGSQGSTLWQRSSESTDAASGAASLPPMAGSAHTQVPPMPIQLPYGRTAVSSSEQHPSTLLQTGSPIVPLLLSTGTEARRMEAEPGSAESVTGAGAGTVRPLLAPHGVQASSPTPAAGFHVLVVDDDSTNRRLAARLLARLGCTCDLLEDGDLVSSALGRTGQLSAGQGRLADRSLGEPRGMPSSRPYDFCLMDQVMVRSSGSEVSAQLRAQGCRLPIFAMTANASAVDQQRYAAAGMEPLIVAKPFSIATLNEAVRIVEQQRQHSAVTGT